MSQLRQLLFKHPAHFCSLGFGSGLAPKAPGTFGTIAGLPLLWGMWELSISVAVPLIVLGFIWGVWCTDKTSKAMGYDDPGAIVWDEIIGVLVAGLPLMFIESPMSSWLQLICLLVVFGLFRLFDIAKPFPVSWADRRYHGGFGIMLDDLLAGVLASLAFTLFLFFL